MTLNGRVRIFARLRRTLGPLLLVCALATGLSTVSDRSGAWAADDVRYFRIGTAATTGTYFAVGGLIAGALSSPPGARECDRGGSCGVPNLIAVAESTEGSVDNVQQIAAGQLDSGLCQADVAYWAYKGERQFAKSGPVAGLRAIAGLYSETIHIVVRDDSAIRTLADLAGRRVSMGERESGTLADSVLVLDAAGLTLDQIKPVYEKLTAAVEDLRAGTIDALFLVAGPPVPAITDLSAGTPVRLIPIDGAARDGLRQRFPFFQAAAIPAGSYSGQQDAVATLGIQALWVVSDRLDDQLVFDLTRALWHDNTRKALEAGSPMGRQIRLQDALAGVSIPLHPGARKYYDSLGKLSPVAASIGQP